MMAKWTGPYSVVEDVGKGVFRLKNPATGHVLKKAVHAIRLKKYYLSSENHRDTDVSV